jgi:hypothetical protein
MPEIITFVDESYRFTVKLVLDMQEYCDGYKSLIESDEGLKLVVKQQATEPNGKEVVDARKKFRAAELRFHALRESMMGLVTELTGGLHWNSIKLKFSQQCDPKDTVEALLLQYLTMSEETSHVLHCLNLCFVELLKNSMDSLLKKFLANNEYAAVLEMGVQLSFDASRVRVILTDNAGGFPPSYIESFAEYVATKKYKSVHSSDKLSKATFFFGGAGRGVANLLSLLLDGETLRGFNKPVKDFEIGENDCSMHVSNTSLGAQITLSSPFKPPKIHRSNEQAGGFLALAPLDVGIVRKRKSEQAQFLPTKKHPPLYSRFVVGLTLLGNNSNSTKDEVEEEHQESKPGNP